MTNSLPGCKQSPAVSKYRVCGLAKNSEPEWSDPRQATAWAAGFNPCWAMEQGNMARHRSYSTAFKRQIGQEYLAGEVSLHGLAKRHDICRNLIRLWVEKYERGEFDE